MPYRLRLQGFRKYPVNTTLAIQIPTASVNESIALTDVEDSNDVATKLLATLQSIDATIARTTVTAATASVQEDFRVANIVDDSSVMTAAIIQDGTELNTGILTTADAAVPLAPLEGVSQAHGRLIAWTDLNAIHWSSQVDLADFDPSIATQANRVFVEAVEGRIIFIGASVDGFIIYSTGGIVGAKYTRDTKFIFKFDEISALGVTDPRHIAIAPDAHYVWTMNGLQKIDIVNHTIKPMESTLTDWLKEYRYTLKLDFIANRYLMINVLDNLRSIDLHASRQSAYEDLSNGALVDAVFDRAVTPDTLDPIAIGGNLYPTYKRAFVFDTALSKWGVAEVDNLSFFSYMPINQDGYISTQGFDLYNSTRGYRDTGIGCVLTDGSVSICNDAPTDAWLVAGKYNLSRRATTQLTRVKAEFVDYPDALITVEPSWDGRSIEASAIEASETIYAGIEDFPLTSVAKWFNIIVSGRFNLKGLGVEGSRHGTN